MTPEEFKVKMEELNTNWDTEAKHDRMDKLMCEVLRQLGYGDGVEIFENTELWYA